MDVEARTKGLQEFLSRNDLYRQGGSALLSTGCCPRCVLRALNVREHKLYTLPNQTIRALLLEGTVENGGTKGEEENPTCVVCLGSLQHADGAGVGFESVAQSVRAADYQLDDFSIGVQLPLSVWIRQRGLEIYMRDNFSGLGGTFVDLKEALKWVGGQLLCADLKIDFKHQSDFQISLVYVHEETQDDHLFLRDIDESGYQDPKPTRKQRQRGEVVVVGAGTVVSSLAAITDEQFKKHCTCPGAPVQTAARTPTVHMEHASIFFAGRYLKFSRTLSQTPWVIDGVRKTEMSVQDYIEGPIKAATRPLECKFNSSGREDCDVRMLGPGRPFSLECLDPHRVKFDLERVAKIQEEVNSSTTDIQIKDLQVISRKDTMFLKDGEETKKKTYTALVWFSRPITSEDLSKINNTKDLVIHQKTPIRVLHRRSLAVRPRTIHTMHCRPISAQFATLELCTQAGTYIKEFVHGDMGRTLPNIGTVVGCRADILQLDVTDIDLDWPPPVKSLPLPEEHQNDSTNDTPMEGEDVTSQPRIKFHLTCAGSEDMTKYGHTVGVLSKALEEMERLGAAPILADGKVGGNVAAVVEHAGRNVMLVSRSGKPPGHVATCDDFCLVVAFDVTTWHAWYLSPSTNPTANPSSDTPLLWCALLGNEGGHFDWTSRPMAALHGHAFETPEGASRHGAPISHDQTVFSTPEDRAAMVELFLAHPYPTSTLFIRRGHGFFLLGESVQSAFEEFQKRLVPLLATN